MEHVNHFDLDALENLASIYGFEIVSKDTKTIPVSIENEYPAVYAILKKQCSSKLFNIKWNGILKLNILKYIDKSKRDVVFQKFIDYAYSGESIIIWGAGSYTQQLLATTKLVDCNIVAIVDKDKNKQGLYLHSIPIQYPDIVHNLEGTIIISAALYAEEIKRDISAMGLKNTVAILC